MVQEPACKPLISLDLFKSSPVVELTYIFNEVRLNPEKLHIGFLSVKFRGNNPPQYDEALYDCHRRTVEWAVLAQAAREPLGSALGALLSFPFCGYKIAVSYAPELKS